MLISLIPTYYIEKIADKAMVYLEECRKYMEPRSTPETLMSACELGEMALWGIFDDDKDMSLEGVCVTNVTHYPACKMLTVVNASGVDAKRYAQEMLDILDGYGMEMECIGAELIGPPHVVRWATRYGFKKSHSIAEKWYSGRVTETI
jgi:hypothetical protein